MENRMDKYSVNSQKVGSRTEKNKALYESVKNSSMTNYEIKSNVSVIDDNASNIDVGKVRKMLDERYSGDIPKRKSIEIPKFDNPDVEDTIHDTKEYDINAIIAKAKVGKNVDYNKERLKKVRDTQYEILNNLDLELKKNEDYSKSKSQSQKDAEDNLMNLINTITQIEIKNKQKDTSLDLLSDLAGDGDEELTKPSNTIKEEETANEIRLVRVEENESSIPEEQKQNNIEADNSINTKENVIEHPQEDTEINQDKEQIEVAKEEHEDHVEKTLSKLEINMSSYDDFADISKRDKGSLVIKIIIFIIIIILVFGAIYILNDILNLGLF